MNVASWIKVGPGYRLRDGREAEVLATDMGGYWPVLIRYRNGADGEWVTGRRSSAGRYSERAASQYDLIRPVEVSDEALAAFGAAFDAAPNSDSLDRWRRAGLAAAFAVMLRERGLE